MLNAMMNAPVGDDVFSEDPTIIELQEKTAKLFGKQAGLYCPSGTMTNQIAIKLHTQPLDEVICDKLSHIYKYENGAWAMHSGVSMKLIAGNRGRVTAQQVEDNIQPEHDWLPRTKLVSLENTCNSGGGSCYDLTTLKAIKQVTEKHNLKYHLDGARVFNALNVSNFGTQEIGVLFDTISVCLSKGLGAPVGSVLLGTEKDIKYARRIRKAFGGGMRQAGILAAAGIYALNNNVDRLTEDHRKAKLLEQTLKECSFVSSIFDVETNIVIFEVDKKYATAEDFVEKIAKFGVLSAPFSKQDVRFVTHLDIDDVKLEHTLSTLKNL
ncbi:UNVERIFIED_CONTAM: hypothetical protein GTU68_031539 [Idotea baltica]|nr:hypothetical protein [Idotea baltica]